MKWINKIYPITYLFCFSLIACGVEIKEPEHELTFDNNSWKRGWDIRNDIFSKFLSKEAEALKVSIPKGSHYGASIHYRLKKAFGAEPESLYFRYYLKLGADWSPQKGGKFPGLSGTYGNGGWGGRKANGQNGWSVRGLFHGHRNTGTPFGFYVYHMNMPQKYGDEWLWKTGEQVVKLEKERWYCIEYQITLNSPQKADGILKGWIDGEIAFNNETMRFRSDSALKIQSIWLNVYMGGKWTDETDNSVFIDDLRISSKYIGPSNSKKLPPSLSSEVNP